MFGTAMVATGAVVLWQAQGAASGPNYERIGPWLFPQVVAAGLVIIGAIMAIRGWRRPALALHRFDLSAALHIVVGIICLLVLFEPAGFVIAATVLFAAVARAFGSRRLLLEVPIGLALALGCQLAFTKGLSLYLPWGILSGLAG